MISISLSNTSLIKDSKLNLDKQVLSIVFSTL